MKKILLTSIAATACCVSAFGQGQILFENADSSSGFVTITPNGPKTGSGLVVELLWYNGTSFVLYDTFTSTFTGNGSGGQSPGKFNAGQLTIPQSGTQIFEVEAFYTSGAFAYEGMTPSFTAKVTVLPNSPTTTDSGTWDGNLVFVPEPSTVALGGLGAAVMLLFRRRK